MFTALKRHESRKSPIFHRWLVVSLCVHGLMLLALTQFAGGHLRGNGAINSSGDDSYSVTWIPGTGEQAGGGGVDTVLEEADQNGSAGVQTEVEIEPEPENKPIFDVAENDPQKVFNETAAVAVNFDPNGAKTAKIETEPEERALDVTPGEVQEPKTAAGDEAATASKSSGDNADGIGGKNVGANGGQGQGEGNSSGNGSNGIKFFGIFARARKVVYIIDASESMKKHNAMNIAREELFQSLKGMAATDQFQVIFFDAQPHVMAGQQGTKLLSANPRNLLQAERFAKGILPESGTDRFAAISLALGFKPEVIFLLTDADDPKLSAQQLDDIRRINKRRTSINVVEFGIKADLSSDSFLKKLARQNGGKHFYRDLTK